MPYQDILLPLQTYPDPTPSEAVAQAVALCAQLGTAVAAVAPHVQIPLHSNGLADFLVGLTSMAREEEQRSHDHAMAGLSQVRSAAAAAGLTATEFTVRTSLYETADRIAALARTRDLTVIPLRGPTGPERQLAEAVIFGSGRPAVVFQPAATPSAVKPLDLVAVAWDGGRAAARAVADALPILTAARRVRVVALLNEKASVSAGGAEDLVRHLKVHGIVAEPHDVDVAGEGVGKTLARYADVERVGMYVMGAFGHSRMREFVLGGATQSMLDAPPVPVLLSH